MRRLQRRGPQARLRQLPTARTFAVICLAILGPTLLSVSIQVSSARPDFYYLMDDRRADSGGVPFLPWIHLDKVEENKPATHVRRVRMAGYMMDPQTAVSDGSIVEHFTLLPDCGTALHPAHADPDEMVDVWLHKGNTIRFQRKQAVRVTGKIEKGRNEHNQTTMTIRDAAIESFDAWSLQR